MNRGLGQSAIVATAIDAGFARPARILLGTHQVIDAQLGPDWAEKPNCCVSRGPHKALLHLYIRHHSLRPAALRCRRSSSLFDTFVWGEKPGRTTGIASSIQLLKASLCIAANLGSVPRKCLHFGKRTEFAQGSRSMVEDVQ